MPRRITAEQAEVRAQIKALEAITRADKAEREAAERPIRLHRRKLAEVLNGHRSRLQRTTDAVIKHAEAAGSSDGLFGAYHLKEAGQRMDKARTQFRAALTELQTFDVLHNVSADYPTEPAVPDVMTIKKQARADMEARIREEMDRHRQSYSRPSHMFHFTLEEFNDGP